MSNQPDDRFDEWVKSAAKGYNRPPDIVPRDAMWEELQLRSQRSEVGDLEARGAGRDGRGRPRLLAFPLWSLAAAAVLLLAAGIGLGRLTMRSGAERDVAARNGSGAIVPSTRDSTTRAPAAESLVASAPRAASSQASRLPVGRELPAASNADVGGERQPRLYDIAAVQHLAAAEALLTSFRASRDTSMDDVMRRWARDLLSTTRLLLDSPAAGDAQRRKLLEDLEVVLIQMVKLPTNDARFDRELIERSIARQQVLIRIRTSIPAGAASGT